MVNGNNNNKIASPVTVTNIYYAIIIGIAIL